MTGFDEYGCGDRVYEDLRRNLIGDLVRNCQERVASDDHVFGPGARCRKKRNALAFAYLFAAFAFVPRLAGC
jgi:hypothetical protein